ncbi:hypothetical protein DFH09DRAFT_1049101 [Mycena vulgaris]|nr:hypothetical protein DFH09DRAFT_1049101 [Mycena vulgaris]
MYVARHSRCTLTALKKLLALEQDNKVLQILNLRHTASKRGHDKCLENTRADVLKNIEWIDDLDGPNLFWLYGHPGTGKSTIATTVVDRLRCTGRLGSCFFFRREDFMVQTPGSLWCSVAYDLGQQYPRIRHAVLDQLKAHNMDPDVTDHDTILDDLLVPILGVLLPTYPEKLPVIVIDALDECGGGAKSYQRNLLSALSKWQSHSKQLKIFVTSRDEGDIRRVLGKGGLSSRVLEVGRNVSGASSLDIKTYFRHSFDQIREDSNIGGAWPTESQLQSLTDTASGLFIWASTVVKLVETGPPKKELKRVLNMIAAGWEDGTDSLTELYESILNSKFSKPDHLRLFLDVARIIIVARTPLSLDDLHRLFSELDRDEVEWVCEQLKSVLVINPGVHFVHKSFVDFLVTRPTQSRFYVSKEHHEHRFAAACFSGMKALHFNMGNIETSYFPNDGIPGLQDIIPSHLKYSCQFWATHLENSGAGVFPLNIFATFMKSQLLYWLEVMSIERILGTAAESLAALIRWGVVCKHCLFEATKPDENIG